MCGIPAKVSCPHEGKGKIFTSARSGFLSKFEELIDNEGTCLKQQSPSGWRRRLWRGSTGNRNIFVFRKKTTQSDIRDGHSWKTFCCFLKSENHRRVIFHYHAHLTFLTLLGRLFKYLSAEGAFAIIPSSEETQLTELRMGFAANSPFSKWISICEGEGAVMERFQRVIIRHFSIRMTTK